MTVLKALRLVQSSHEGWHKNPSAGELPLHEALLKLAAAVMQTGAEEHEFKDMFYVLDTQVLSPGQQLNKPFAQYLERSEALREGALEVLQALASAVRGQERCQERQTDLSGKILHLLGKPSLIESIEKSSSARCFDLLFSLLQFAGWTSDRFLETTNL
jgi:hypothetical protein